MGADPQAPVNPDEIIVHEVQRHGRLFKLTHYRESRPPEPEEKLHAVYELAFFESHSEGLSALRARRISK